MTTGVEFRSIVRGTGTASPKGPLMLFRIAWLGVRHLPLLLEEAAERGAERLGIVHELLSGRRVKLDDRDRIGHGR